MDIVERLRGNTDEQLAGWQIVVIMHEAADEIERLRKDRDRLRKALREIAEEEYVDPKMTAEEALWYSKEARAALKDSE